MKPIKLIGLAFAAVFAISVVAATSASAAEFLGKVGEAITGSGGTQTFTIFDPEAHKVKCKSESVSGEVTEAKSATSKEAVKFEKCEGFGGTVKVETGNFVFKAPAGAYTEPGTVEVEKAILVENVAAKCKITVTTTGNSALSEIKYGALMEGVEVTPKVTGISYTVAAGGSVACGTAGSYSNGEYSGEITTVNKGSANMMVL